MQGRSQPPSWRSSVGRFTSAWARAQGGSYIPKPSSAPLSAMSSIRVPAQVGGVSPASCRGELGRLC